MISVIKGTTVFLLALFLLSVDISYTQTQFPIGVYSGLLSSQINPTQILNAGANLLISDISTNILSDLTGFQQIIPYNAQSSTDRVNYYSNGYYQKWEAENTTNVTRAAYGNNISINGVGCYFTNGPQDAGATVNNKNSLFFSVNPYYQDPYYRVNYPVPFSIQNTNTGRQWIPYHLVLSIKKGTVVYTDPGCSSTVFCTIQIIYNNEVKKTMVVEFRDDIPDITSSADFFKYDLTYDFSEIDNSAVNSKGTGKGPVGVAKSTPSIDPRVGINIIWNGNRDLYIDNIEIKEYIGDIVKYQESTVANHIQTFVSPFGNPSNLAFWYGQDEPASTDNNYAYGIVEKYVKQYGNNKKLIASFQPYNPVSLNYEGATIAPWYNSVNPAKLMFDFYPINKWIPSNRDASNYLQQLMGQICFLHGILKAAHESDPNFYSVVQAHSYDNSNYPSMQLLQPTSEELNLISMLPLAYGAKGLVYYPFYSFASSPESTTGLYNNSSLLSKFTTIADRLKNTTFGQTLLNLTYSGDYIRIHYNTYEEDADGSDGLTIHDKDNLTKQYLTLSMGTALTGSFHCGIFNNVGDTKYFMIVNKIPKSGNYQSNVNAKITDNSYVNWKVQNVIGGTEFFCSSIVGCALTIPVTDGGRLFKAIPVVKNGGRIVSNETISSAKTLTAPMTIAAGCTLTVSAVYTINSNITVEEGGRIVYTGGGSIVLTNGAQIKQNVMAVDNSNALANNSQRKIVRTYYGDYYMVYESMNHVWLEKSTDGGSTWQVWNNGNPLDAGEGKNPSIDSNGDILIV